MEKTSNSKRYPILAVGFLAMISMGILYAWSIFKAPLASEFQWSGTQLSLNFTLTISIFCLGGIASGFLLRKYKPGDIIRVVGVMIAAGFILTSANKGSIGLLYFSYAGLCGLGIGIAYTLVISCVNTWFPDKKGLCSGVLMMGFGLSTLVIGNLAGAMFQMEAFGWRKTFLLMGIYIGIISIVASFFIRFPSEEELAPFKRLATARPGGFGEDIETKSMLKRSSFWMFFLFIIATTSVGSTVISFARDVSLSVGAVGALANLLVGFLSVFNGIGRMLFGLVFDRAGLKKTMILAGLMTMIAPAITIIAIVSESIPLVVLGLCLTGVSYSSAPTVTSIFIQSQYGTKYFAMNFSITNLALLVSSMIAPVAANLYV